MLHNDFALLSGNYFELKYIKKSFQDNECERHPLLHYETLIFIGQKVSLRSKKQRAKDGKRAICNFFESVVFHNFPSARNINV